MQKVRIPFSQLRRSALLALLLALLATSCAEQAEKSASPSPPDPAAELPMRPGLNVVVVSFDALRADALGAYGSQRGATPHLDAFAAESMVFADAYSAAPVTPTSFSSFFSGMLPTRIFHGWRFVPEQSLATHFSAAGYETAAFVNNVQLAPQRGFGLGFDLYDWRRNDPDPKVADAFVEWLGGRGEASPFFAWVHLLRPHAPYFDRPPARHLYRQEEYSPRFEKTTGVTFEVSDANDAARIEDLYQGEVWIADRLFGRLHRALEERQLLDSTIVVLTADHGEEFGEHGGFQHGRLYEEHLRVPLILHHPDMEGGTVSRVRARTIDLMPSLLYLTGQPVPETIDGRPLPTTPSHPPSAVVAVSMTSAQERSLSLLEGSEKLIVNCLPRPSVELYDLASDPGESRDLSQQQGGDVRRLLRHLDAIVGGPACRVADDAQHGRLPEAGLDREDVEALKSLGYLR